LSARKVMLMAPVRAVDQVAPNTYRIRLFAPEIAQSCHAGNFVNILIPRCGEILWRRPFSIHQSDSHQGTIDILFSAIGRGTKALRDVRSGDLLDVLGPLGNEFNYPANLNEAIIVAGGLGIAVFPFVLQSLKSFPGKKTLFYGVKTKDNFCSLGELRERTTEMHLCTDDGSMGEHGLVTDALERYLSVTGEREGRELYVCGPTSMMKRVQMLAQAYGISAQVSVENKMACGFGACVGCPVTIAHPQPDSKKYWLACKDGPVFPINEIVFDD